MDDRRKQQYLKISVPAAAFAILFSVVVVVLLPTPWAFLAGLVLGGAGAAGTYGLLQGRELSLQRRTAEVGEEQKNLRQQLQEIDRTVRQKSRELPPSTQGQLRMMVVGLEEIVGRWQALDRVPEQQEAVRRTVEHHLPQTVVLFLQLPDSAKPQYAEEFKNQISLLAEAVAKTRDRVVRQDLQALRANRWLLEESLTDPDEKLFREHGL